MSENQTTVEQTNFVMPETTARWAIYAAIGGLALLALRAGERADGQAARARDDAPIAVAPADATAERLRLGELEAAGRRGRMQADSSKNLFPSERWNQGEFVEAARGAPPSPLPSAQPQAPPLPFAFMGKLVDAETTIVFLTRDDRTYLVRLGDTVDAAYRIEEIGQETMTLTYLPLGVRQSLGIGDAPDPTAGVTPPVAAAAPAVPAPLAPDARPTHDLTKLVWSAPAMVEVGEEFTVEVGLPAGAQPRAGQVDLVYDTMVLAMLGGAARQTTVGATTGRAVVEVIGPGFIGGQPTPSEVRFRVLAGNPTTTRIVIENLSATTPDGKALALAGPSVHPLEVVKGTGKSSD
jgi:hypothetical protein